MTRVAVLGVALAFILGLAFLTISGIEQYGLTFEAVTSVFILVLLTVGIVGALRNPPRK
jgi:amino acid transporter